MPLEASLDPDAEEGRVPSSVLLSDLVPPYACVVRVPRVSDSPTAIGESGGSCVPAARRSAPRGPSRERRARLAAGTHRRAPPLRSREGSRDTGRVTLRRAFRTGRVISVERGVRIRPPAAGAQVGQGVRAGE